MIKCVIFDMDGTIANTLPLCVTSFHQSIEPFVGRELSDEEIISTFGPSEEGTIRALIPDDFDEGMSLYLKRYSALHEMCLYPFDGIMNLLKLLKQKGILLALVTGKGIKSLQISLDTLGLNGFFDVINVGSSAGPNKPTGMRKTLQKLRISPQEAVYIGDAPSDITAAREVGIPIISATWADSTDINEIIALRPDMICNSVAELQEYMSKMLNI